MNGQPWRWLGVTAFALPMLHAHGVNIDPFLDWAIAKGFTTFRCLFAHANIAQQMGYQPFLATTQQTYALLEKLKARQARCEWSCGDMQMILPKFDDQVQWFNAQTDVVAQYELASAETCNEPFKNGVDVGAIGRFGKGIVQTSGNYDPPCNPRLDYGVTHTPRDEEWPRKGKELYDLYQGFDDLPGGVRIPWVSDEPMGSDEVNQPGKRSNVSNDFFDDSAVCSLMGAGGTHHGTELVYGRIPGPKADECATAYVAGSRAFPADVALGTYTRGGLSDSPLEHDDALSLRTFARLCGSRAYAVAVRPVSGWHAVAQNGWRIVAQSGPDGRIVTLEL